MSRELEKLIGQWAQSGDVPASSPGGPGELCISYQRAEQIALQRFRPSGELADHLRSCAYCQRLVADMAEAVAEEAAIPEAPTRRLVVLSFPRWKLGFAAAAAAVIIFGIVAFHAFWPDRCPTPGPMAQGHTPVNAIVEAGVFLRSELASALTPKGPRAFASRDHCCRRTYR